MSSDKSEKPTRHKLVEARRKGQAPKSPDVGAAAALLSGVLCLAIGASFSLERLSALLGAAVDVGSASSDTDALLSRAFDIALEGLWVTLPIVLMALLAGLISSFGQVGIKFSLEPVVPDLEKVNPASGLKRMFSLRTVLQLLMSVAKAVVLSAVVYFVMLDLIQLLVGAFTQTALGAAAVGWSTVLKLLLAALVVFLIVAPADFVNERWLFTRDQRMSKQDIKREYKDLQGDPQIKGRRLNLAREAAREIPRKRISEATVVVTNPTHYAVALRYVPGETPLPVIIAKGADEDAAEIRRIAAANNVPLVGNPPLARALYRVPLDDQIPEELFGAVAAVVRWVSSLENIRNEAQGLH
jgi:type III secretion protein U